LLLGPTLAALLGRAVRGCPTRLLAMFVMLNLLSLWMGASKAREMIPVTYPMLLSRKHER
jgi:hypothetical protein